MKNDLQEQVAQFTGEPSEVGVETVRILHAGLPGDCPQMVRSLLEHGAAILYADRMTGSMERALAEIERGLVKAAMETKDHRRVVLYGEPVLAQGTWSYGAAAFLFFLFAAAGRGRSGALRSQLMVRSNSVT